MVWTTQEQLLAASQAAPDAVTSLYGKGKAAGIADNETVADFVYLKNEDFLAKLVEAEELDAEQSVELQKTVSAGYPFDPVKETNDLMWGGMQTALFYSSLPETYAYKDIAIRLAKSGQLINDTGNRVRATGKLTTAMVLGMAGADGTGLHQAYCLGGRHMRLSAVKEDGLWLINQASMSFTLLTFSATPFAAMGRGEAKMPTAAHQLSWLKMWNVIGSLMGIEDGGLPETMEAAGALDKLFRASPQFFATAQGKQLISALVELVGSPIAKFNTWATVELMELLGVKLAVQ